MDDETDALHLAHIVESDDPNEGFRVFLLGLLDLVQYLGWVSAPKHGQLPHGPVPAIVVPGGPVVVPAHKSSLLELSNRKRENKPKEAITVPNSGAIRIVYTAI